MADGHLFRSTGLCLCAFLPFCRYRHQALINRHRTSTFHDPRTTPFSLSIPPQQYKNDDVALQISRTRSQTSSTAFRLSSYLLILQATIDIRSRQASSSHKTIPARQEGSHRLSVTWSPHQSAITVPLSTPVFGDH